MALISIERIFRDPFAFLCLCLILDVIFGDPQYRLHPIRVTGKLLAAAESALRKLGWDGRFGGFVLFLILTAAWFAAAYGLPWGLREAARRLLGPGFAAVHGFAAGGIALRPSAWAEAESLLELAWKVYLGYSLLALGDLIAHGRRIARETLRGELAAARAAAGMLVGRDTDRMDFAACNRAAVESLAESLVDGVLSPLFWLALFGLPGLIVFKIASTMDSMVGYKTERYQRFGWFGARLDDVLNWIPARLSLVLISAVSLIQPGSSARRARRVCLAQHALLPGPNKGWSETAAAGALGIRLAGPIWKNGKQVNDLWIGPEDGPEGGSARDVGRMIALAYGATALFLALAFLWRMLGGMRWTV